MRRCRSLQAAPKAQEQHNEATSPVFSDRLRSVRRRDLTLIDPWPECHDHLVLYQDRDRAGSFGEDAKQYDRARPGYPASLIDDLFAGNPHVVLDVGCGTDIAGRLLVDRGASSSVWSLTLGWSR